MPTLADLKAQHPEWCWKCGVEETVCDCWGLTVPVIAALIAKAREDEARIEELTQCDPCWYDASPADAFMLLAKAQKELAAEREAHEVTRKALAEADKALVRLGGRLQLSDSCATLSAHESALAREEARKKVAEHE